MTLEAVFVDLLLLIREVKAVVSLSEQPGKPTSQLEI